MNEADDQPTLPPRRSIDWVNGRILFIDQRLLPGKLKIVETDDWHVIAVAIRGLGLRGAPLIGVAAALAVAATAVKYRNSSPQRKVLSAIDGLLETRPTTMNLFWALDRMRDVATQTPDNEDFVKTVVKAGREILKDDRRRCTDLGKHGSSLIQDDANILTICNTGFLATAGEGTALAAVYRAYDRGKKVHIYTCETRPLLQGARLTVWELENAGIPFTLLVDSAAAGLCASGNLDLCIIGADRIAANGDTANKIGSYQLALACREHGIPYYVVAPESTIDRNCHDAGCIPIEERAPEEVSTYNGKKVAPVGTPVWNPAFDVVPAALITGIVTENGIHNPPYSFS